MCIHKIYDDERYNRTYKSNDYTLYHKGRPYKEVRRSDVFHDIDLILADWDAHGYGIADQENRNQQKDNDDAHWHISYQEIESA